MRHRHLLIVLPVLLLALSVWGIYHTLWTEDGVRSVLQMISRLSPITCSAEKVSGRLAGSLTIEGLDIIWPEGRIKIQKLESVLVSWKILEGRLAFKKIRIDHMDWEDRTPEDKPADLNLPKISSLLTRLWLEVSAFEVEDIRYHYPEESPLILNRIRGTLACRYGLLVVNPLHLKHPHGILQGQGSISLLKPGIQANLDWRLDESTAGLNRYLIQGKLTSRRKPEQMAGPVTIRGLNGSKEIYWLQTEMGVAGSRLNFRKISLREKNRQGQAKGEVHLRFEKRDTLYEALLNLEEVDLSSELKRSSRISGPLRFEGRGDNFKGQFDLKNKGRNWENLHLNGEVQGGFSKGIEIQLKPSQWLGGSLNGSVTILWQKGVTVEGALHGQKLKPEEARSGWKGLVNAEAQGRFEWDDKGFHEGSFELRFPESQFQGKTLRGGLKAHLDKDTLIVDEAELRGQGFFISGSGILAESLKVEGRVDDLSALWPEGKGSFRGLGWVRWRKERFGGEIQLEGKNLAWKDVRLTGLKLDAAMDQEKKDTAIQGRARIQKPGFESYSAEFLNIDLKGTLAGQEMTLTGQSGQTRFQALLDGSYRNKAWNGKILQLSGESSKGKPFKLLSPAVLQVSPERIQIAPSVFSGTGEERLNLTANLDLKTVTGNTTLNWQEVDLSRIGVYSGENVTGRTTGQLGIQWQGADRLLLQARADFTGTLPLKEQSLKLTRAGCSITWDDSGLRASWNMETDDRARLWGQASSTEKGHPALPRHIHFNTQWEGVDINLLLAKTPPAFQAVGRLSGEAVGDWWSGSGFAMKGSSRINNGVLNWKDQDIHISAQVKTAETAIDWRENRLKGSLNLELERYGKINGDFNLPLMSRFPVAMEGQALMEATIKGDLREKSLMTSLLPEAVSSGEGRVQGQISARGNWDNPNLQGAVEISEPEVEVRSLGLRIKNISVKGTFDHDRIQITNLKMTSGPGVLNGTALFRLKNWRIASWEGKLTGDRFQLINRPGLDIQGSPKIDFSGSPDRLVVGGIFEVPQAMISGGLPEKSKRASEDVVIVDRPKEPKKKATVFPIQGQIKLVLGKDVRLKAEGLDGNLEGTVEVRLKDTSDIKAFGEIKMVKGSYMLQGQKLNITRGRFIFNGPPDNPGLDVLALKNTRGGQSMERRVEDVRAGIMVSGNFNKPVIRLYSQPPLPDTDILSYILFDQALSHSAGGQQNMAILGQAAKTLLGKMTKGGPLPGILSPETLEVRTETTTDSSQPNQQSLVTVGKYLDPRLYLGVGGSLFTSSYSVILRYSLTRNLEIETKGGTNSGGGIYFRMNFE
jgi:translocation and assembly module TamB